MKLYRILAIAKKQFLTLRHDRRSLMLMLIAPVMAMLIFGFAFGEDLNHVPVIIVNSDQGEIAQEIIDRLDSVKLSVTPGTDVGQARSSVEDGNTVAVLYFAEDFSQNALPTAGSQIELYIDSTNQQLAGTVVQTLADAVQKDATSRSTPPITIDRTYAFEDSKDARYIDYFVPGVMAFAAMLFTTLLTLLAFVGERTSGTLDRLRSTPVTAAEIVLGYELAFGAIAAIQGLLLLIIAIAVYHVLIVGSVALAAVIIVLTAIDAQAIGIVISAAAQREGQAVQFIPFIVLPTFLLSGIFVPISSLPVWLRPFSYLLLPTWAIEGLRDVFLRGWGLSQVWPSVVILAGFALLFTLVAIIGLRRSK